MLTLSAGEIAVGLLVVLLPAPVISFLLAAPVEGTGAITGRIGGVAFAAQGIAWWLDRKHLDAQRLRQVAAGYVAFNAGIGLVFLLYSATAGTFLPVPCGRTFAAWRRIRDRRLSHAASGRPLTCVQR